MKIYDLVIVGGGPAGIGAAVEAIALGMKNVLLIDKGDNHSQTIRNFYKDNKRVDKNWKGQETDVLGKVNFVDGTKESTLDFFDQIIAEHKVETLFNTEVEKIKKGGEIFDIFIATGMISARSVIVSIGNMGKPNKPDYKIPNEIKGRVNFNLDNCSNNESILVVGGGNSALEYAYDLCETNSVVLSYRKNEFARANPENIDIITQKHRELKLSLWLNTNILSLESFEERIKVNFEDRSEVFDRVIYAIGGTNPTDFLNKSGIKLDDKGFPILDNYNQTNIENLYVSGDLAMKNGGSIAIALNHSYNIINHINSKGK